MQKKLDMIILQSFIFMCDIWSVSCFLQQVRFLSANRVFTDLHAVEVLGVFHYHAVSQDQQIANVSHLTGVVRGERGGGVAHRSQNSYGTGRRERKEEKRGEETGRVKRKRAGGEEGNSR